jgi:tetratricopeptide (TPR) repeat protein
MARSQTQKKSKKQGSGSAARPAKTAKAKATGKASIRKRASKAKVSPVKAKKKVGAPKRHPVKKSDKAAQKTETPPVAPPRLLRRTKTTTAALALLEKGIGHIHKRDFKKARAELKTLLETYPGEVDILARARSYIRICKREEAAQRKPPATTDQLYALGILEHNKANYDSAISYFLQSLESHPEADYIYYSVAASLAMKGDLPEAVKNLRKAVELNEDSRIYAKNDADFFALQTQKEFMELVGLGSPSPAKSES